MKIPWIKRVIVGLFLATAPFLTTGCGCGDGEVEVCSDFLKFMKNGDFGDGCICVQQECVVDEDCDAGFICSGGFCIAP